MAIHQPFERSSTPEQAFKTLREWHELSPVPDHLANLVQSGGPNAAIAVRQATLIVTHYLPLEVYCSHMFEEGFTEKKQTLGVFLAREIGTNRPALCTEKKYEVRFDTVSGLFVPVDVPYFYALLFGNEINGAGDEDRYAQAVRTRYDLPVPKHNRSVF